MNPGLPDRATLDEFYDELEYIIRQHNITPDRLWDMDECGIEQIGRSSGGRAVVPASASKAGAVITSFREHITLVAAVNAEGKFMAPHWIVKGAGTNESAALLLQGTEHRDTVSFTCNPSARFRRCNSFAHCFYF